MHYDHKKPGKRIKILRVMADMSQSELSDLVGISQAAISMYETGQWKLHADLAIKLAAALNTTPAHLMALDTVEPTREIELA